MAPLRCREGWLAGRAETTLRCEPVKWLGYKMNVKDLIEILRELPKDSMVVLQRNDFEGSCPSEWCNNGEAVVISGRAGSIKLPLRAA